jgi:hypothetical protein
VLLPLLPLLLLLLLVIVLVLVAVAVEVAVELRAPHVRSKAARLPFPLSTYQLFLPASHRAPNRLTSPLSSKGTCK